jgi:hypothetical protein
MPKPFLSLLFLSLPLSAFAECGFVNEDQGVTIVVGSKGNKCFASGAFREAFKENLVASIRAMEGEGAPPQRTRKKAFDTRNSRGEKLWAIAERRYQETTLGNASYYGQR